MTTNEHTEQSERAELIRHMVNRFLGWKLPQDFYPDNFISFDREKHDTWRSYPKSWPTGTNLFTADQTKKMLEHLMDGYEPVSKPVRDLTEAINASGCERIKDFYSIGPVQRAAIESFAAALLASDKAGGEPRENMARQIDDAIRSNTQGPHRLTTWQMQQIADVLRHTHPHPQPSALPDEVVKDAERYRHLRKHRAVMLVTSFFGNGCINKTIEDAEYAIDAAILMEKK